jgi:hypothetical protein
MSRHRNYGSKTSFLDLLFNTLLAFVAFFVLSLMLISEKAEPQPKIKNIEFMITVTWPYGFNDDVDTYVIDPLNNITCFNRREDGLMHLDRDDIGHMNDTITLPNGKKIEYKENREIVSIRGIVPGEYVVNVHCYSRRTAGQAIPVNIRLEKMNPYKLVSFRDVELKETGSEETVFRFGIDKEGNISYVTEGPKRSLIKKKDAP